MTTDSTQTESNELTFQKDAHLHPEFVDGKFRFSIVVDSDTEAFHDAAVAHCGNNDSSMNITLDQVFPTTEIIECVVEAYGVVNEESETLDIEAKPFVDQIREDLVKMLARIDAFKYKD